MHHNGVNSRGLAQPEMYSRIAGGKIAAVGADLGFLLHASSGQLDSGAKSITIRFGADCLDANPMSAPRTIAQELGTLAETRNQKVEAAIVVEVSDRGSAADFQLLK
jgi:hypothetical protein